MIFRKPDAKRPVLKKKTLKVAASGFNFFLGEGTRNKPCLSYDHCY